jgi:hypothetical protein
MNDADKDFIRKLNFVALLTALRCIGNGSYQDAELDLYWRLAENKKSVFDFIVRDVLLQHHSWSDEVDIGLAVNRQLSASSSSTIVTMKDVGDLSTFVGLDTIDANKRRLDSSFIVLEQNIPLATLLDELQIHR